MVQLRTNTHHATPVCTTLPRGVQRTRTYVFLRMQHLLLLHATGKLTLSRRRGSTALTATMNQVRTNCLCHSPLRLHLLVALKRLR